MKKKVGWFCFFFISQFCYDKNKNENLIKKSIDKNFTIYLAREKMIINKKNYLQKKKILFFSKKAIKILLKLLLTHSLNVCKICESRLGRYME